MVFSRIPGPFFGLPTFFTFASEISRTMEENFSSVFVELSDIISDQAGMTEELKQWNRNYLKNHKARYQSDFEILKKYYRSGRILEIGSAPFHFTYLLHRTGFPVTGLDIAPDRFAGFLDRTELEVLSCNIETQPLPFEKGTFHLVVFNEIFEHLRIDPVQTLENMREILHPDGMMILSTPNLYSFPTIVRFLLGRGFDDPYEQFDKLRTFGHMGHVREYSVRQVKTFLKNTGFIPVETVLHSHRPLRGLWTPFNILRKAVPRIHAFQTHICRVSEQQG
jgi:2-polyprenyl-3-methyl-5-hydroxy-6-metoxy-1,4-benzoquinol methylase